jgi:hypothetical protein
MFIDLKKEGVKANGKTWSVRRQPDGVYIAVNDAVTTFNRNPVLTSGISMSEAKKVADDNNKKRGPEYGFDFKGR